ncbi:MAG: peptidyl-prolyl cis-trans isomerase [Oleispira sp.]|nr:peptidyl-prolyl cis-trans isomerase [Oleispira sp.]MBL4880628.1 peptidyl-prolyl cis-trans isomerase [Oleispira sp.]
MTSFFKEPLLHFLLLGGVLLFVYSFIDGEPDFVVSASEITLSDNKLAQLTYAFKKTHQRLPDENEHSALVVNYLKDEVAYKKGVEMGLLEGDALIKKRIRQKLEFIIEDAAQNIEPTEQQLSDFLAERVEEYRADEIFSFSQVYIDPKNYKHAGAELNTLIALLQTNEAQDLSSLGDAIFLEPSYNDTSYRFIARDFGSQFADTLKNLQPDIWHSGIKSGYGLHLVKVTAKKGGEAQSLGKVRDQVRQQWFYQQRQNIMKAFYDSLFKEYGIKTS